MFQTLFSKEEKKVEYIELIYDLIFVYIVGRNNSLLHTAAGGFIPPAAYLTYIITTMIALQIWYFSVLFINRYGSNRLIEHIGLFINMFLLYYMADATRASWQESYLKYNIAWGLILINLAVQYLIRLRRCEQCDLRHPAYIRFQIFFLLAQAGIVFLSIPVYLTTGFPASPFALLFGLIAAVLYNRSSRLMEVDFAHMSERVMLYVVFTFGEMIISIAVYFETGFSLTGFFYSLMAFLIVVGLFFIYGYFYNNVIDRERVTAGAGYMFLHIFLITALNNLTVSLEFMREPAIDLAAKTFFLVVSFLIYFFFLFLLQRYAKCGSRPTRRFTALFFLLSGIFVLLMRLFGANSIAGMTICVSFIYGMLALFLLRGRQIRKKIESASCTKD